MAKVGRPKTDRSVRQLGVYMNDKEWDLMQEHTENIKNKYGLTRSEVLRKVLTEYLSNECFLKMIGVIK